MEDRLKPFEFSNSYSSEVNNAITNKLSTENALMLILFSIFIQSIIYFGLNFLQRSEKLDLSLSDISMLYIIVGALFNLILLIVSLTIKFKKWRGVIIFLALVQIAIFIYYFIPHS